MKTRLPRVAAVALMAILLVAGLAFAQGKVDINKADVKGLMSLKGIGQEKAKAIVKYRQMNGPFQSASDLANVPGIGKKTVANNKDNIVVGQGTSGKKGAIKAGKKATAGAAEKAKKAAEKPKKGMAGAAEKMKKDTAGKAKKAMSDTVENSKKTKPAKQ